jgi:glycerol-3-phosphate O-acyltransferase
MNLGTMHIDICDPISLKDYTSKKMTTVAEFNPFKNHAHQLKVNADLAYEIVYILQKNLRMMPTTMVASLVLQYRKGISHAELSNKMMWLGMIIKDRGAKIDNDTGLPGRNTIKIGLEHLNGYLENKSGIYSPDVEKDLGNIIMLTYYRNPLNQIFFNEGIILCAIHSFGLESGW